MSYYVRFSTIHPPKLRFNTICVDTYLISSHIHYIPICSTCRSMSDIPDSPDLVPPKLPQNLLIYQGKTDISRYYTPESALQYADMSVLRYISGTVPPCRLKLPRREGAGRRRVRLIHKHALLPERRFCPFCPARAVCVGLLTIEQWMHVWAESRPLTGMSDMGRSGVKGRKDPKRGDVSGYVRIWMT
jgi:hypothetical protein